MLNFYFLFFKLPRFRRASFISVSLLVRFLLIGSS